MRLVCRRDNVLTFKPSLFPIDCSHGMEENTSLEFKSDLGSSPSQQLTSHFLNCKMGILNNRIYLIGLLCIKLGDM